jgi:DNA-binding transcriptional regulator YdaS (Cro superfamily)
MTDSDSLVAAKRAALQRAIDVAGGQVPLAQGIETTQSQVSYWLLKSKKGVPAEFCPLIENMTGVPRHELRPDVYPAPQLVEQSA